MSTFDDICDRFNLSAKTRFAIVLFTSVALFIAAMIVLRTSA